MAYAVLQRRKDGKKAKEKVEEVKEVENLPGPSFRCLDPVNCLAAATPPEPDKEGNDYIDGNVLNEQIKVSELKNRLCAG